MRRKRSNMNRLGRWFVGATFLAAFAASILLLSGCGDTPMSPTGGEQALGALQYFDSHHGDLLTNDTTAAAGKLLGGLIRNVLYALDYLLVGDDGGLLSVELGTNTATFEIPVEALNRSTLIVMNAVQTPTPWGEVTVFDFGPDGLVFEKPATLSLETSRANGSELRLFWWNESTQRWDLQESCVVRDGRVSFSIHHFSKYGIS